MGTAWPGSLKAKGTGLSWGGGLATSGRSCQDQECRTPSRSPEDRNKGVVGTPQSPGHPSRDPPCSWSSRQAGAVRSGGPAPGHSTTAPGARPPHSRDFRVTLPGCLLSSADFLCSLIRGKVCDPDGEQGWGPRLGQRRLACPSLAPEMLPLLMGLKGAQPPRPSHCSLASPRAGWRLDLC